MNNENHFKKLKDSIAKIIDNSVQQAVSLVDEYPKEQPLSFEKRKEKAAIEQREVLENYQSHLDMGMNSVLTILRKREPYGANQLISWLTVHIEDFSNIDIVDGSLNQLGLPLELLELIYQASLILLENDSLEEAYAAISVCLVFNQSQEQIWFTLGEIFERKEQYESALYAFQMALVLNPENPFAHSHQARLYAFLELWEPAFESLEKIHRLISGHEVEYSELNEYCLVLAEAIEINKKAM